ncbi:MAG: signal peptide peptidase SppA [Hyphomicrobiales bacterium]|nr:signal peptide peptidase SppA [Hyphomicrobiales bacterium]
MTLDADIIVERRRLKRRLVFWRTGAIIAAVALAAILIANPQGAGSPDGFAFGQHIARITINGVITDSRDQQKLLEKLADSENASAVIVHINSPGGTTAGGEMLYRALRRISEKKPVVAVFGTAATSAAYMAGIATDFIIARGNTITGSVGVIFQWPDMSGLLDKIGVKVEEIKSGPLKATPSPYRPTDEASRQASLELVMEAQTWFLSLVTERRKLAPDTLEQVKTGRVFSGRQAVGMGLVDALGDEMDAREWLARNRDVPQSTRIIDWEPESSSAYSLIRVAAGAFNAVIGGLFDESLVFFNENASLAAQRLDGLVSVWQLQKSQ